MTMNRRDFLRMGGFLTVSTATVGLTGCFHDEDDETAGITTPEASGSNWAFPQSVASADPKPDSIVLWTRVTPSGSSYVTGNTTANLSVRLVVSTNSANAGLLGQVGALIQGSGSEIAANTLIPAYAKYDGTIRHKLTGLTNNKVYYYQFVAGNVRTKIGRFKTAPAASATPSQLKFAFMSCQDWNSNHWGAFQDIVSKDIAYGVANAGAPELDFVVHLGDYIYETTEYSSGSVESKHGAQALPNGNTLNGVTHAATLADYRYLYKIYRSDTRIQAFHERFPIIAVWDDHEFSDDSYGNAETYTNANTKQSGRRQAANQAWFEFMPADIAPLSSDLSTFQTIKIYRDLQFGTLMHLIMTDERLYRSDHLIPETTDINPDPNVVTELGRINSRYLAPEASLKGAELTKAGLGTAIGDSLGLTSVLGQTQRDWWKSTMSSSTATWKVWGNEVSLLRMALDGTKAVVTLMSVAISSFTAAPTSLSLATASAAAALQLATGSYSKLLTTADRDATTTEINTALVTAASALNTSLTTALGDGSLTSDERTNAAAAVVASLVTSSGGRITPAQASPAAQLALGAYLLNVSLTTFLALDIAAPIGTPDLTTAAAAAAAALNIATASYASSLGASAAAINAAIIAAATTIDTSITGALAGGISYTEKVTAVTAAATSLVTSSGNTLTAAQVTPAAQLAVGVYLAVLDAAPRGLPTQLVVAEAYFIGANAASAFLQKFIVNADQWDGYQAERKNLMNYLQTNNVQNVVAVTGDIHAFFAGPVYNDYAGEVTTITTVNGSAVETAASAGGTPVMVDLVTAGISSASWFSYLKDVVSSGSLSSLGTLVYYTIPKAAISATFPFDLTLPILEFTLGRAYPSTSDAAFVSKLTTMVKDSLKKGIATSGNPAGGGAPEAAFALAVAQANSDAATVTALTNAIAANNVATINAISDAVISGVATLVAANSSLRSLCFALAGMNNNPWLQHIDTDAQGYAVVTMNSSTLTCQFHHVNQMLNLAGTPFGVVAPGVFPGIASPLTPADTRPVVSRTTTITLTAGAGMPASLAVS